MKMTRYSEPQILAILRQAEGGVPVAELCREHGMMPLPGSGLSSNHGRERVVLQMAGEVWRHGRFYGQPDEGHGSSHWFKPNGEGEPQAEADVCGPEHAERFAELRR